MRSHSPYFLAFPRQLYRLGAFLAILFVPVCALAQSSSSRQASLRGTAKINGALVADKVMIVLKKDRPVGKPVPAWVDNRGKYRIENIAPDTYKLVATGASIKEKVIRGVEIKAGNSNIINIELERKDKATRIRGKVKDSVGRIMRNARIAIYSSELPPAACAKCQITEVVSNEFGEIDYPGLASQQSYNLAILSADVTTHGQVALAITPTIAIGDETETLIELQLGGGSRPDLIATVLRNAPEYSPGGATPGWRPESKEEKAVREAREKEIAEIERKNAEIVKSNELVSRVFKAGNDALFATPPRFDEAISNYREGLAARPEEVALLTNLAEALRQRADNRYNASVKEPNAEAKLAAQNEAKKDWTEGAELASKAVSLVKAATPAGANVNAAGFEQNKKAAISVRAILLRRVASKVDPAKAADALTASQEYLAVEADPAKKARNRSETLQMLFDAGANYLAIAEAQKVLAEEPDNPDANRILGLALFATGDKAKFQEAANYLQRYVDKAPDTDPSKQSAKESLDFLKTAENVRPERVPARPARRRP